MASYCTQMTCWLLVVLIISPMFISSALVPQGDASASDSVLSRVKRQFLGTNGPWGMGQDVTGFLWGYILHQMIAGSQSAAAAAAAPPPAAAPAAPPKK